MALIDSDTRFDGVSAPTGSGKTGVAFGLAQLLPRDERLLILTSNTSLQRQIKEDGEGFGLRDLQGKRRYRCDAASSGGELAGLAHVSESGESWVSVEHGPCFTANAACSLKLGGCRWFDAIREVQRARIVSTSYAKWFTTPNYDADFGKFQWLVADEAHDAIGHLTEALHIEIRRADVESLLRIAWPGGASSGMGSTRMEDWREWAQHHRSHVEMAVKTAEGQVKDAMAGRTGAGNIRPLIGRLAGLKQLAGALTDLRTLPARSEWALDDLRTYDKLVGVQFDPVWPAAYSERLLFRGIPRVVLMSATLIEKHLDLLGVPREQRTFTAYPSAFAAARRPVIYVPSEPALKLNWRAEQNESTRRQLAGLMDRLIEQRADRNGLILTGSYKRARYLLALSSHRDTIITHSADSGSTKAAVARFREAESRPPVQLMSPAVGTGYDFPGRMAEYVIIPKLPFRDQQSALMKARCAHDPQYSDFETASALVQWCGRGMRAAWDQFESLILDAQMKWFPWANRELFPKYFLDAIRVSGRGLPIPPPRLRDRGG